MLANLSTYLSIKNQIKTDFVTVRYIPSTELSEAIQKGRNKATFWIATLRLLDELKERKLLTAFDRTSSKSGIL